MTTPNVGEDVEQPEFSYTAGGNAKQLQPLWKTAWQSRNVKQTLTIQSSHPTLKYLPQRNKNLYSHRSYMQIFIVTPVITAKPGNNSNVIQQVSG